MRPFLPGLMLVMASGQMAHAQEAAMPMTAEEAAALRAEVQKLREEVAALKDAQSQLRARAETPVAPPVPVAATQPAAAMPSWIGAPQFEDAANGWSFKPRGRLHYDTAYIGIPGNYAANRNLGFNSRVRRVRLGAEGTMPGGFRYRWEADFANTNVTFGDVYISYVPPSKRWIVRAGNMETLEGLDQQTSASNISFLERAQFNDAFVNTRRLGVAAALTGKDDLYRVEAGLFAAHSIDSSFDNDGWIGAMRLAYAPRLGGGRVHIAANYQHRNFQSNDGGVASVSVSSPSTNQLARYRARPFLQTTDVRFVDTGSFAASGDDVFGVELGGIFGSIHLAGEAQWTKVDAYRAGALAAGLDAFAGGNSAVVATGDPTFFGAYGEVGWFITGETRAYRDNVWGRTKVLKPLSKGGPGAWQLVARLDYLDLDSRKLINGATNNFATGVATLAPLDVRRGRGGTQTGLLLGVNWYPLDYMRIMLDYFHVNVKGGPLAALVKPLSVLPVDQRSYSTDALAARLQIEF